MSKRTFFLETLIMVAYIVVVHSLDILSVLYIIYFKLRNQMFNLLQIFVF